MEICTKYKYHLLQSIAVPHFPCSHTTPQLGAIGSYPLQQSVDCVQIPPVDVHVSSLVSILLKLAPPSFFEHFDEVLEGVMHASVALTYFFHLSKQNSEVPEMKIHTILL